MVVSPAFVPSRLPRYLPPLLLLAASFSSACRSLPPSTPGPEAEALAERMLTAINHPAWLKDTAAVTWTFRDKRTLFWDRRRNFVRVTWKENDVRFNKDTLRGSCLRDAVVVPPGPECAALLAEANKSFVNDAFWLNPLFHIRSPGAQLSLVAPGVLKVHYPAGGVTPGDSYVFFTDAQGLVTQMRLWVSSVPLKGTAADFGQYATSETGVKSARVYDFLVTIKIGDVHMFPEYPGKDGADLFAGLVGK